MRPSGSIPSAWPSWFEPIGWTSARNLPPTATAAPAEAEDSSGWPPAPPAAPAAPEERNRQQPPAGLVGDLQLDIARIPQLVPQFLDGGQSLRPGGLDVGQVDSLVILVHVVAVSDVEIVAG